MEPTTLAGPRTSTWLVMSSYALWRASRWGFLVRLLQTKKLLGLVSNATFMQAKLTLQKIWIANIMTPLGASTARLERILDSQGPRRLSSSSNSEATDFGFWYSSDEDLPPFSFTPLSIRDTLGFFGPLTVLSLDPWRPDC